MSRIMPTPVLRRILRLARGTVSQAIVVPAIAGEASTVKSV